MTRIRQSWQREKVGKRGAHDRRTHALPFSAGLQVPRYLTCLSPFLELRDSEALGIAPINTRWERYGGY